MSTTTGILFAGFGYSASHIVPMLPSDFAIRRGTTRNPPAAGTAGATASVDLMGFDPASGRLPEPAWFEGITHILVSIPPDRNGRAADPFLHAARHLLAEAPDLRWIGYFSTTGVYGDRGGAWVGEESPASPVSARSRARLAAEQEWQSLAAERGIECAVFRLSGIYGPGRNALASLADGTARRIIKPGQVFNRIHVDDIALGATSAMRLGAGGIFNLSDDEPAPPQDVITFASGLCGIEAPAEIPFEEANLSPMAASFYAENKRVSNTRTKSRLALDWRHPDYRSGLTAMWEAGNWRG